MNDPIAEGFRTTPLDIISILVWIVLIPLLIYFLTTRKKRQLRASDGACMNCGASANEDVSYCTGCGRNLTGRVRWFEWLIGIAAILAIQAMIGLFRL